MYDFWARLYTDMPQNVLTLPSPSAKEPQSTYIGLEMFRDVSSNDFGAHPGSRVPLATAPLQEFLSRGQPDR
jgi:hypothetical protein